jgi:TolA-binding protein
MKRLATFLLLFVFVFSDLFPYSQSSSQSATSLGEEIYSDLLDLEILINELNNRLMNLDEKLLKSEQSVLDLEQILNAKEQDMNEREQLLTELQTLQDKRERTVKQLSILVDDQRTAYKKSLRKWKFTTITLGVLNISLASILLYQRMSKR